MKAPDPWRRWRIGDRVRLTGLPEGYGKPGYFLGPETQRLFHRLIARNRPLRISVIHEGIPMVRYRWRIRGRFHYHSLSVTDDCWIRAARRNR